LQNALNESDHVVVQFNSSDSDTQCLGYQLKMALVRIGTFSVKFELHNLKQMISLGTSTMFGEEFCCTFFFPAF
jgi:hypothetical protein